jgi:hypothetical protein
MLEREDLQTLSSAAAGNSVLRAATRTHESSNQKNRRLNIWGKESERTREEWEESRHCSFLIGLFLHCQYALLCEQMGVE